MKVLKGNIKECRCGAFLQYDEKDIEEVEKGYDVGTYNGETYMAKFITCPVCKRKIEMY